MIIGICLKKHYKNDVKKFTTFTYEGFLSNSTKLIKLRPQYDALGQPTQYNVLKNYSRCK